MLWGSSESRGLEDDSARRRRPASAARWRARTAGRSSRPRSSARMATTSSSRRSSTPRWAPASSRTATSAPPPSPRQSGRAPSARHSFAGHRGGGPSFQHVAPPPLPLLRYILNGDITKEGGDVKVTCLNGSFPDSTISFGPCPRHPPPRAHTHTTTLRTRAPRRASRAHAHAGVTPLVLAAAQARRSARRAHRRCGAT